MMIRILLASMGAVFLGVTSAFFLFVSLLSIATVLCILVGLTLMFALGVHVGTLEPLVAWHPQLIAITAAEPRGTEGGRE